MFLESGMEKQKNVKKNYFLTFDRLRILKNINKIT